MAKKSGKNLVIVESPAKAKTINKYLGDDYIVKASMGHVRDLPSKGMGVDLKTFEPEYVLIEERGKGKLVAELKKLAKDAPDIYLATDLDREGEAIAWHLKEALGIPDERVKRVIFNAITKAEIQKAFKAPQKLDINRVNAQQARRILDRIVGYEISPLLWKKVARGLSAGRVQSVAVRLVVDREKEIAAFIPTEHWKIGAIFTTAVGDACAKLSQDWNSFLTNTGNGERTKLERESWLRDHEAFVADLIEVGGEKFQAGDKSAARKAAQLFGFVVEKENTVEDPEGKGPAKYLTTFAGHLEKCPEFVIEKIEKKRTTSRPPAPFITSTLQQGASSRLGMGAQQAMRAAQTLYEGGYITYMRTDSTHLSGESLTMAREYIDEAFGGKYVPEKPNSYTSSNKSAQEAHEAIRPTDVKFTPEDAHQKLGPVESKVYGLIWRRFVACQMAPAEFDATTATIAARSNGVKGLFRASGRILVFDGFMKVSGIPTDDVSLPNLSEQQPVGPVEISPTQHFTQPPPRFSEASLVKELERLGIGRPSTYASIIQTIQDRQYVEQIDRRFYATLLGSIVTEKLIQAFPDILDVGFTAGMETKLDEVEEDHADWIKLLKDFYGPFHNVVDGALGKIEHAGGTPSPYNCSKCGKQMLYRISKNGFFLACSDRECGNLQPVDGQGKPTLREKSDIKCPICGREMIKRKGRFGEFLGCSGYSVKNEKGEPSCSCIINLDKDGRPLPPKPKPITTTIACTTCGSPLYLRDGKRGPWLGCSKYPKCRGRGAIAKLSPEDKKQIDALTPLLKEGTEASQALIAKIVSENPAAAPTAAPANVTTDIDCDECGKPMMIRKGRRGPFLGCSGYPKCKNTGEVPAKLLEELGIDGKENGQSKREAPLIPHDEPLDHEDAA
jgi:DNA topoisomerase-1